MIKNILSTNIKRVIFSIAIDRTKVPKSLNINTAYKCIIGSI